MKFNHNSKEYEFKNDDVTSIGWLDLDIERILQITHKKEKLKFDYDDSNKLKDQAFDLMKQWREDVET